MSVLDSLYSMLAQPVRSVFHMRRQVNRISQKTQLDKNPQDKATAAELLPVADNHVPAHPGSVDKTPLQPRERVNKPLVERRARRSGSHIDIEV